MSRSNVLAPPNTPTEPDIGEGMVEKAFFRWLKATDFSGPISQHHEYDHGQGQPIQKMRKDLNVLNEWLRG